MARLYKKVVLLVSRSFSRGEDGLEVGGLVFFRSMDEYNELSKKNNWESGKSCGTSWCVRPTVATGYVEPKRYARFMSGQKLGGKEVLFDASQITQMHDLGRFRQV